MRVTSRLQHRGVERLLGEPLHSEIGESPLSAAKMQDAVMPIVGLSCGRLSPEHTTAQIEGDKGEHETDKVG